MDKPKKNLAFLLGITPDLAFAAGNVALSLYRHMKNRDYDVVVFCSDLPENDRKALEAVPHVHVRSFSLPEDFVNIMLERMPEGSRFRSRKALMCFCHFEVFSLLDEYECAVWLDADISVQRDLSPITQYAPFGLSPDTPWRVKDQFSRPVEGYDMDVEGLCTAVMLADDSLPYRKIYAWLYEKAVQYADRLVNPDQAVIALMVQHFGLHPRLMPLEQWQCISWRNEASTARIVHFGSERKVWRDVNVCNAFPEWFRTHLDWLELGGSDFDRTRVDPHNVLGALDHFDRIVAREDRELKKKKYYLFDFLPLYRIRFHRNVRRHYLFSFIPFIKVTDCHD